MCTVTKMQRSYFHIFGSKQYVSECLRLKLLWKCKYNIKEHCTCLSINVHTLTDKYLTEHYNLAPYQLHSVCQNIFFCFQVR